MRGTIGKSVFLTSKSTLLVFLASGCRLTSLFVFAWNTFSVWSGVVGALLKPGFFADFLVFPLSRLSSTQVGCPVEAFLLYAQLNTRWLPNHRLLLDAPRLLTWLRTQAWGFHGVSHVAGTCQDLPYPITAALSSRDPGKASCCYIQAEARETKGGLGQVPSQLLCQLGLPL